LWLMGLPQTLLTSCCAVHTAQCACRLSHLQLLLERLPTGMCCLVVPCVCLGGGVRGVCVFVGGRGAYEK
jgi:hypothetical protein